MSNVPSPIMLIDPKAKLLAVLDQPRNPEVSRSGPTIPASVFMNASWSCGYGDSS